MSFTELLSGYIGQTIEVFLTNQYYLGTLLSVDSCFFVIQTSSSYYYGPSTLVTVHADSVQYIRVISA